MIDIDLLRKEIEDMKEVNASQIIRTYHNIRSKDPNDPINGINVKVIVQYDSFDEDE